LALDRESIARRDFPAARRGYDPAAVDRHLSAIADEVDALKRRAAGPGAALATQTSEQVRTIIEAAEASAAGIRDSATADARQHVARVAEAADALRERIDALEREMTTMLASLRGGADRLRSELDAISEGTARLAATGGPPSGAEPVPEVLSTTVAAAAPEPVDAEVDEEPAGAAVEEAPARKAGIDEAKLIAYGWAFEGRPREETERYLAENFELDDLDGLLTAAYSLAPKA
jgi:DivIVA domain-containing protein